MRLWVRWESRPPFGSSCLASEPTKPGEWKSEATLDVTSNTTLHSVAVREGQPDAVSDFLETSARLLGDYTYIL